jgi:hypothetical protein
MPKKGTPAKPSAASHPATPAPVRPGKPSSLLDTRVVYCGDNLEQLAKLPDACVDLIYIDPPFNSNRNYEVFWGETKEKRAFEDLHASTQAYIDYTVLDEDEEYGRIRGAGFWTRIGKPASIDSVMDAIREVAEAKAKGKDLWPCSNGPASGIAATPDVSSDPPWPGIWRWLTGRS